MANSKLTEEFVEGILRDPPEFLKFPLGKSLEEVVEKWYVDINTLYKDWSMQTAIDDLIDQIFLWLPREQDSSGTQNIYTEVSVDTHNGLLRQIKSKLRRKEYEKS
jgi:hypothetical protein